MFALKARAIRLPAFLIGAFQNTTTTVVAIEAGVFPSSVSFNHKKLVNDRLGNFKSIRVITPLFRDKWRQPIPMCFNQIIDEVENLVRV
jgi:hypothetical protein